MKILEHSSKRLVIYSRPIGVWLASALFPILGIVVGSSFLEITSFNCKRNEPYISYCQAFVIQTRRTQLIGIEIKQNEGVYQLKLTTTDQHLEWFSLVFFVFWMALSLYLFLKVIQTRTCIFDKTTNQLTVEIKGLFGKKADKYPLNEIIDIVISGGGFSINEVPTEPVDLILSSIKNVPVYISLDTNIPSKWYLKAHETVALIQSFLGLETDTSIPQELLTNIYTQKIQSIRIINCNGYIIAFGNMPVKYSDASTIWGVRQISSIGDIPVKYKKVGKFVSSQQIISIGDISITYSTSLGRFKPCIYFIGDMAVQYDYQGRINSIGAMGIQYQDGLLVRITAIGNMNVQTDSYGRIVEIHCNSGFNLKQFVSLFLVTLASNTNRYGEGGGG
jgi:hypothetical protein